MNDLTPSFHMKTVFAVVVVLMIGSAFAHIPKKNIPPVDWKTETSDKSNKNHNQAQEINVNLPSSLNINLREIRDKISQEEKTSTNEKTNSFFDPINVLTFFLVFTNVLLWCTSRTAAKAAKDSADSAVKSVIPVIFPYITDMSRLHPLSPSNSPVTHSANIFIAFDNYGKTPGIIREIRADLFLTERDELPEVNVRQLTVHGHQVMIPGDTRGKDTITGALDLKQPVIFSPSELNELLSEARNGQYRRFYLLGQVIYDDFFGMSHTSRFCIKLRLFMENSKICMFQVAKGGGKYNKITSKKIPKNSK